MTDQADTWAIVELMGHVRLAGRLSEEERFGSKMGRLDIPTSEKCVCPNAERTDPAATPVDCCRCRGSGTIEKFITQWFGGSSVYRITVVAEPVARHVAKGTAHAPVSPWDFPKQIAGPATPAASVVHDRTMRCGHTPEDCNCEREDEYDDVEDDPEDDE